MSSNNGDSKNGTARHAMSLRLSPDTWEKLEQIAFEVKRKTGFRVSYNVLLATLIEAEHAKLGGRRKQLKALWAKR